MQKTLLSPVFLISRSEPHEAEQTRAAREYVGRAAQQVIFGLGVGLAQTQACVACLMCHALERNEMTRGNNKEKKKKKSKLLSSTITKI